MLVAYSVWSANETIASEPRLSQADGRAKISRCRRSLAHSEVSCSCHTADQHRAAHAPLLSSDGARSLTYIPPCLNKKTS